MIMALLNGRPASGKTTLALHLAAAWAVRRERVIVVDASTTFDAVRWQEARIRAGLAPRFRVVPAAAQRLGHRSLSRLARRSHVIIDGPSGDSALSLPALLASDLAIIPTRPSPGDMAEVLAIVGLALDSRAHRRAALVRFLLNRSRPSSDRDREIAEMRAEYEPALLDGIVDHHAILAEALVRGRVVDELDSGASAYRDIVALAHELLRLPLPAPVDHGAGGLLARLLPPWVGVRGVLARHTDPAAALPIEDPKAADLRVASGGEPI